MYRLKNPAFLEISLLVLVVILQFVWLLPNTIAIRNTCLIGGGFISLLLILFYYKPHQIQHHVPLLILLGVPIWLYIHYLWIPVDLKLQWYDLSGTWLRVTLGVLIAYSLGKILIKKPRWGLWILCSYILMAVITLILFFKSATTLHTYNFIFTGWYKTKIAGAYFMVFNCLICFGLLLAINRNNANKVWETRIFTIGLIAVIGICILNCIAFHSLIGVAVNGFMGLACALLLLFFKNKRQILFSTLLMGSIIAFLVIFILYDAKYEGKLANLKNDFVISLNIEKNKTWSRSNDVAGVPDPIDINGRTVNLSTYERTSWLIKGSQLIIEHPLGTGFSWSAFKYYMTKQYPGSTVEKTHSAWLDFALGVGLPGLFLTWSTIFLILKKAFRQLKSPNHGAHSWIIIFVVIGISLFWVVGEVSEREFIEHFFFVLALSASYLGFRDYPSSLMKAQ
jgi:O-Antigen ligase